VTQYWHIATVHQIFKAKRTKIQTNPNKYTYGSSMAGGVTVILSSFAFNDSSSSILRNKIDLHDFCNKNTIFCYFVAAILN
jgi:hypothetical protein